VRRAILGSAVLVIVGVLGLMVAAHAQMVREDSACRTIIQKTAAKVAWSTIRAMNACAAGVFKGTRAASTDCTAEVAGADAEASARALLSQKVSARCDEAANAAVLARFPSCPSPGQTTDDGGATSGIDSFAEVASCQAALDTKYAASLVHYVVSGDTSLHPATYRCATAIQKGAAKLWRVVSKEHAKCQRRSDLAGGSYDYGCDGLSSAKVASAIAKTAALINDRCSGLAAAEWGRIGSCAATSAEVAECVVRATLANAEGLTANAYGHAGECPARLRVVARAGNADGGRVSATDVDVGWSGFAHDGDYPEGLSASFNLSCSTPDCEVCSASPSCDGGNCRCSTDESVRCDTPYAAGGACGAGTCVVHFGPPRGRSIGGLPVCIVDLVESPAGGSTDVGTGVLSLDWTNAQHVYLGISQLQPCPLCSAATIGAAGTCMRGARDGLACETDAIDPDYGSVSYDCAPRDASELTAPGGLRFDLALGDATTSLSAALACDPPLGSHLCQCGVCSGDTQVACSDDATCAAIGIGTCGGGAGVLRQPNACADSSCTPVSVGSGEGTCAAGPIDRFCDGVLRANGEGSIPCLSDADCAPLSAGACTQTRERPCFLDTIARAGFATPAGGVVGWVGCTPPTTNAWIDAAAGLPGPSRRTIALRYEHYCADGATPFLLGGSVCM